MNKEKVRKAATARAKSAGERTATRRNKEINALRPFLIDFYVALADTYIAAGGELSPEIVDEYFPLKTYEFVHDRELISSSTHTPESDERRPDDAFIGEWRVNSEFKRLFYAALEPVLTAARLVAETGFTPQWKRPTPAEHVHQFRSELGWDKKRVIEAMADKLKGYADPAQAMKVQLNLIIEEPANPNFRKHPHDVLCEVMRENSPRCAKLKPEDLVWRRQSFF